MVNALAFLRTYAEPARSAIFWQSYGSDRGGMSVDLRPDAVRTILEDAGWSRSGTCSRVGAGCSVNWAWARTLLGLKTSFLALIYLPSGLSSLARTLALVSFWRIPWRVAVDQTRDGNLRLGEGDVEGVRVRVQEAIADGVHGKGARADGGKRLGRLQGAGSDAEVKREEDRSRPTAEQCLARLRANPPRSHGRGCRRGRSRQRSGWRLGC